MKNKLATFIGIFLIGGLSGCISGSDSSNNNSNKVETPIKDITQLDNKTLTEFWVEEDYDVKTLGKFSFESGQVGKESSWNGEKWVISEPKRSLIIASDGQFMAVNPTEFHAVTTDKDAWEFVNKDDNGVVHFTKKLTLTQRDISGELMNGVIARAPAVKGSFPTNSITYKATSTVVDANGVFRVSGCNSYKLQNLSDCEPEGKDTGVSSLFENGRRVYLGSESNKYYYGILKGSLANQQGAIDIYSYSNQDQKEEFIRNKEKGWKVGSLANLSFLKIIENEYDSELPFYFEQNNNLYRGEYYPQGQERILTLYNEVATKALEPALIEAMKPVQFTMELLQGKTLYTAEVCNGQRNNMEVTFKSSSKADAVMGGEKIEVAYRIQDGKLQTTTTNTYQDGEYSILTAVTDNYWDTDEYSDGYKTHSQRFFTSEQARDNADNDEFHQYCDLDHGVGV